MRAAQPGRTCTGKPSTATTLLKPRCKWQSLGARRLHIVDLDGAVSGMPHNREAIRQIRAAVDMHIEIGGGIRDLDTISAYLDDGIDSVILGTAAIKNPRAAQRGL